MRALTDDKLCYLKVELNAIKMVGCSAVGCSNSFTNNDWSFYCLPKFIELHKKWLQAMRRVDIKKDQKVVLIKAYFNPGDFKQDLKVCELWY